MAVANKVFYYAPDNDTKIAGLYDLQHTIGRGHYAVVKLARHVFTGEKVAVKVIDKTKLDSIAQDHLFQEVVCMKLVQHPNVVRLYEVIDTPNKLYLILELGDGGDLYDYIMKHGTGLNERLAKRYFRQIVTAIAYCHKLHVVHRDLKPENVVFFEKLGLVKLTDFGFSNRFTPGTHLDTACGSLAYSAPEILLGDSYDAPKVDIWSLGVILYMLVCGRLPFQETNDSETLTKIMDCEYTIPDFLSPECANLIQRLLIRDPSKRAHLDDVLQADWLRIDHDDLPIELFSVPLVSRECLSFEDHMEILSKMSEGQLATVDEIQATLDRNEYNHIAATYFLLAERKLKRNYIEEYKRLSHQAQQVERLKQQQQQQQLQHQPQTQSLNTTQQLAQHNPADSQISQVTGKISPWGICAVNQATAIALANNPEERIRRFSMILEDEEEEEEEEEEERTQPSSTFSRYLEEEYRNLCLPDGELSNDIHPLETCLEESSNEALIEEEEELVTVASLACVRSDLAADQQSSMGTINTLLADTGPATTMVSSLTRPCSRASGLLMDTSDGAESDASLSNRSTSGGSYTGPTHQSIASRSLPPGENRRKPHYRHGTVPHRPLISVKSSPQLLKHIAEEEWNGANALERNGNFSSNRLVHEFERTTSSNHSKNALSDDSGGTHSLRASFKRQRVLMSFDDQLVGTRTRFSSSTPRPLSTTHSPTRTRRFFTSAGARSRPTSVGSWSAAVSLSLLRDMRRQSVGSSPVDMSSGTQAKRRPMALATYSQTLQQLSRNRLADRRCSGPPSITLTMSNIYPTAMVASSPKRCGSDNSFTDGPEPSGQSVGTDPTTSDHDGSTFRMLPRAIPRTVSEPSDTATSAEYKSTPLVNGACNGTAEPHSPVHTNNDPHYNPVRSPHRSFSTVQRTSGWCSSAPMLCDTHQSSYGIDVNAWDSGTSTSSANIGNGSTLPGTQSIREYCAPIREEDDEVSRSGDLARSDSNTHRFTLGPRRRSESSGVRATSLLTDSNLSQAAFAALADAETFSTLKQHSETSVGGMSSFSVDHRSRPPLTTTFMNGIGPGVQSSNLTTSNFSLSSLATSLRDSRHMLDVIRGTFELQCHYQRRTANSVAGSSIGGYSSSRASASASVRSLTAISESIPISTGLTSDLPVRYSRRPAPYTRLGLSPDPLNSYSYSRANTISCARRVLSPPRRSLVVATSKGKVTSTVSHHDQYHHELLQSDRFSMPIELTETFYLDRHPASKSANEKTLNDGKWGRQASAYAQKNNFSNPDESSPLIDARSMRSPNDAPFRISPAHFSVAHINGASGLHTTETTKPLLLPADCLNAESIAGKSSNKDSNPAHPDNHHVAIYDSKPKGGPFPVSVSMVTFDSDGDLMTINDYRSWSEYGNGQQRQKNNNHHYHHNNNNNNDDNTNDNSYQENNKRNNSVTQESRGSYHEDADSTANLCSPSVEAGHNLVAKRANPKQLIPIVTAHKTHSKLSCCTIS